MWNWHAADYQGRPGGRRLRLPLLDRRIAARLSGIGVAHEHLK